MTRSMLRATTLAGCLAMAAVGSLAYAADAPMASQADASFVKAASAAGLAEVKLGNLATQNGGSDDVKTFGKTMVDDHTAAGDELKTIATGKSIPVSSEPMPADAKAADMMAKKNGAAFDKAFKQKMVMDHQKVIKLFTTESTSGKDADLKAFATKTLPTLKHHLEMAQNLPTAK
jgi:putative membrane protein